jgi:hypothetical protein
MKMTLLEFVQTKRENHRFESMKELYGEDPNQYVVLPKCYWMYLDSYWILERQDGTYYMINGNQEHDSENIQLLEEILYEAYGQFEESEMSMTFEEMAKLFSKELLKDIGVENLHEVNKLNDDEPLDSICHSHDFTDANQVFIDAIDPDLVMFNDIEHQWSTIHEIWSIAKKNKFYIK